MAEENGQPDENYAQRIAPTDRYVDALRFAVEKHVDGGGFAERRKQTQIPYLSHLLSVSALVWEAGGDEDQAIAGLLHDTLEDTKATTAELAERFGDDVTATVVACSDGIDPEGKKWPAVSATAITGWRERSPTSRTY